jgi:penicillin-binding protein 2
MALAGLELNKRKPDYSIRDPGYYFLPGSGHRYRDWKTGGHGTVDIRRAITVSCDTFFYGLANDLGIDNIHDFIGQFGLGKKTGIDLEGEVSGLLPSVEWKQKRYGQKWYAGDTISVGIGQGYNLTTPLQLAHAVATLANDGKSMRPRLVREIRDARNGAARTLEPESPYTVRLKPENITLVKEAMVDVVRPGGTAAASGYGAPYAFAGKTGTAQVIAMKQNEKYDERRVQERHRDHALFIAYAPAEKPAIAVAVLVENGGHGGSAAAPVARQVFDYYLLGKVPAKPALAKADDSKEAEDD